IERIESYTRNGKSEFLNSSSLRDATLFRLQTIGEAVNQLPNELKEKYPEIPWRQITGLRNLLAHVYWQVDITTVWTILEPEGDLAALKLVVIKLIDDFPLSK
ncbi:MAG: HepT-like ribonuclease domain-containing protein, partial [Cyanobacteria bacterium J06629_2]